MRLTAFFKLYKICILLHRCNRKILTKNQFEKSAIFVKIQNSAKILQVSRNLQNFAKFQKFQLDNLVEIEKCCKFKRAFSCKNRCRYSRKRATLCRNFAKTGNYPPGAAGSKRPGTPHGAARALRGCRQETYNMFVQVCSMFWNRLWARLYRRRSLQIKAHISSVIFSSSTRPPSFRSVENSTF